MSAHEKPTDELRDTMLAMGRKAQTAAHSLRQADTETKNRVLHLAADNLRAAARDILAANAEDMTRAADLDDARRDRIALDETRLAGIADAVAAIADLPDPVGRTIDNWRVESGLDITRIAVPLGVIGMIYESRPNVTADAAALCLKSGNAVILRGSSEIRRSAEAVHYCFAAALETAGCDPHTVQLVASDDRAAVGHMLSGLDNTLDVIVPRGGKTLIARVQEEARVPVFGHLEGVCHVFVEAEAAFDKARDIAVNAKMRRPGICGAAETLLVDRNSPHLAPLIDALIESGCEVRGDEATQAADPRVIAAEESDWYREYLAPIIAVRVVEGTEAAIAHIAQYGSQHTDAIITENAEAAARFLSAIDSAIVMHNCSTQFADGGEFGFGAEIGIATGRFHARGPIGLEQLTCFKYQVRGDGQTRPA